MMLHHLDEDVKAETVAEIIRVLRSGGRLHLIDVGGAMTARLVFRRLLRWSESVIPGPKRCGTVS
jgi:hypothetical protein